MDYTKYVLKNRDELEGLLAGKDNFFVVACNKCFKEFNSTEEPECAGFAAIAEEQGKHITGTVKVDFCAIRFRPRRSFPVLYPKAPRTWWSFPAAWACRPWRIWNPFPCLRQPIPSITPAIMAWP